MAVQLLGAGHQGGHLLLFHHFPGDEVLDVGMVEVEDDHLGSAAGGATRLDGAGGAVADFQEAHEAAGLAAAREGLALAAQRRKVAASAGAVLEDAGLTNPQVHDAAFIDQIVLDGLNEAGMRRRALVGAGRARHLTASGIDEVMPLRRALDAVGPVQASVEPLRAIGSGHLAGEHEAAFIEESLRVGFAGEIAAFPAPVGPAAGQAAKNLACVGFLAERRIGGGFAALEPARHARFGDVVHLLGHASLAEVFLGQDIGRHLRPVLGDQHILHLENDGSVRVYDARGARGEGNADKRVTPLAGEAAWHVHEENILC